ncbi:MAG: WbqC family protein [Muribaculaceae bacterium]|nr:WbqC family protein [Muribaculaceae bacterium]
MIHDTRILYPSLAPNIGYYATIAAHDSISIAMMGPFDKRHKETHRYEVADTRGRLNLTVPIKAPHGIKNARWSDVLVSGHGRWQAIHSTTLASAYGRTPFYEYYIDRLAPALFVEENTPLEAQIRAVNDAICKILLIDTEINYDASEANTTPSTQCSSEYWQIRKAEHGFLSGLSVLDLIFNMGPEAALVVRKFYK